VLRVGVIDANAAPANSRGGMIASVTKGWLRWEMKNAGVPEAMVGDADVVLLVYAGSIDWRGETRRALKRAGINHRVGARRGRPYVVTGGCVDATPFTALQTADALALGEAYRFIRGLLEVCARTVNVGDVHDYCTANPHCLTAEQVARRPRDPDRPHLLAEPGPMAKPDTWVDWDVPPVKVAAGTTWVLASKGCHNKCLFCATSYRQPYMVNPSGGKVAGTVAALAAAGHRPQLVSNDPMDLPYYTRISTKLDSSSFTIAELRDPANRAALIKQGTRMARFGVEGLSFRIRRAFGKPVRDDDLVSLLGSLHRAKLNTHMFYIIGAPYESEDDWASVRESWARISHAINYGICRWKFTAFIPAAPAPLARFIPGNAYIGRQAAFRNWIVQSCASKHMMIIPGRWTATQWENVAEQYGMPTAWASQFAERQETTDMAPDIDTARRLPWEIVEWPIPIEKRYRVSEVYRRRMMAG